MNRKTTVTIADDAPRREKVGDRVTIVQRGRKGIYTAEFSDLGVHRRQSLRTRNAKVARDRALVLEAKLIAGEFRIKPQSVRLAAAAEQFLAAKRTDRKAPKTLVKLQGTLEVFRIFAEGDDVRSLSQIRPSLFDAFRAQRLQDHHEKTVYTESIIIKGFLRWCVTRELLAVAPLRLCRVPKPRSLPRMPPTLDQVNALLASAKGWRRVAIAVLAFTGIRAGELQMLRQEDVGLKAGWIQIVPRTDWAPKTGHGRRIPIHARLCEILTDFGSSGGPYYFSADPSPKYPKGGHHVNVKHLNLSIQRLARGLEIKTGRAHDGLVQHSLRHFFETSCVNARVPQRVVDIWMGHTGDRSMASVYYHLGDKESQSFMASVPF